MDILPLDLRAVKRRKVPEPGRLRSANAPASPIKSRAALLLCGPIARRGDEGNVLKAGLLAGIVYFHQVPVLEVAVRFNLDVGFSAGVLLQFRGQFLKALGDAVIGV